MTEEKLNAFRQTDTNLRDALRMDEEERPQMPADLNERLMQRMTNEEKKPRRIIWPWIAAACVAGVMMIWLTPPKETSTDVITENIVVEKPAKDHKMEKLETAKAKTEVPQPAPTTVKKVKIQKPMLQNEKKLMAQETSTAKTDESHNDVATTETAKPQEQSVTLTERDIPITRPENLKHTPEELALLKKQANEAYLKWMELELEISKYNLEQTAQN